MKTRTIVTKSAATVVTGLLLTSVAATVVGAEDAKPLYDKNCLSCHGASGQGDGPAGKFLKPPAPSFAGAIKGKADADIAKIIKEGGKAVGKSAMMPAFGGKMTDDQIHGMVEYVRGLASK